MTRGWLGRQKTTELLTAMLADNARVDEEIAQHNPTDCVVIEMHIGETHHARSTADVFSEGRLIVTPLDGGPDAVYVAGSWRHATVYDALGYPCVHHRASVDPWKPAL